jgi:hypothetical protein
MYRVKQQKERRKDDRPDVRPCRGYERVIETRSENKIKRDQMHGKN